MKKLRPEVEADVNGPGLYALLDTVFTTAFNITLDELDFFCTEMSDAELGVMVDATPLNKKAPFGIRREALAVRNLYLEKYKNRK